MAMKLKIDRFCSLATSPSWQGWLHKFNSDIYADFMKRLQSSRGCGHNQQIMTDILKLVDSSGGNDNLIDFLKQNHPHVLIDDGSKSVMVKVFDNYSPHILTYPRRLIIVGGDLRGKVKQCLSDKIKSDFVIVDDHAFVEYLTNSDSHLVDLIPASNWAVTKWKWHNKREEVDVLK